MSNGNRGPVLPPENPLNLSPDFWPTYKAKMRRRATDNAGRVATRRWLNGGSYETDKLVYVMMLIQVEGVPKGSPPQYPAKVKPHERFKLDKDQTSPSKVDPEGPDGDKRDALVVGFVGNGRYVIGEGSSMRMPFMQIDRWKS